MPLINVGNEAPGILGLMAFRPNSGNALLKLAQVLLVESSPLSRADRELIATFVSSRNKCQFCTRSHSSVAAALLGGNEKLIEQVKGNYKTAPISEKMKELLSIAEQVQRDPQGVTSEMISKAKDTGATDIEVHDVVLIAAAFCMFNRYVDGLQALLPSDDIAYYAMGQRLKNEGYCKS